MEQAVTSISSKGQVVIPEAVRKAMEIKPGEKFAVFAQDDVILLKKLKLPTAAEAFKQISDWGKDYAKKKGFEESDVDAMLHRRRKTYD
ncbi:MAG: AbrB/MazE/SpoVT family DNA-binding domain-containing protein [Candidatus Micrarchaeota archaeon]